MIPDNHNHYIYCGDIDAMVEAAGAARLASFALCEHIFHIDEAREAEPYLAERWTPEGPPRPHAQYVAEVRAAAATAPVPVLLGIELDARPDEPDFERGTDALIERFGAGWDLVIGSVHVFDGDVSVQDEPVRLAPAEAWADYAERLRAAVRCGRYDIVSHPVRLGFSVPHVPETVSALLRDVARDAAAADVALELNGNDLRRRPELVDLLMAACAAEGAPVSLGSDAHMPRSVGRAALGLPLLRRHGIERVARYSRRERELVPLS